MSNRGFSILEVLLAMAIFMAGMLGVVALQISSTKGAAFSGNLSEASFYASNKLEELMRGSYANVPVDNCDSNVGRNRNFTVCWTVAATTNYKTITAFCEWKAKGTTPPHKVEFKGIRSDIN